MVRIGGLASGMDIDQLVSDLMKAERMPLDKMKQKKQVMEWQRDDYRSMNTLLLNFRTELTQMKLSTKYRARSTTTTNDARVTATATSAAALASYSISKVEKLASAATKVNNEGISKSSDKKVDVNRSLFEEKDSFSVSTGFEWDKGSVESKTLNVSDEVKNFSLGLNEKVSIANINGMNVKVNGVTYEVVSGIGADSLKDGQVLVDNKGNLTFKDSLTKGSSIKVDYVATNKIEIFTAGENFTSFSLSKGSISSATFTIAGKEYKIDDQSADKVLEIKNGDDVIGTLDKTNGKVTMNSPISKDTVIEVNYQQNYTNFKVGSYTSKGLVTENFNIQGSESLNNVINKVNSSTAGVTMFYDSFTDRITLTRTETGNFQGKDSLQTDIDGNIIKVAPEDQEIVTSGEFIDNVLKFAGAEETGGDNAVFTINGLKTERSSNTFDISGVTFTLKQIFEDAPVNISINNNTNDIYENIKGFVDKYNELIGKIQSEVSEEKYKTYTPLTDEQREQLSDKQQEQWEEKAKSGTLRRDPTLSSLLTTMRTDFYTSVNSEGINPLYKQLSAIGIKTTANYLEGGKLEINEAELKKAIEADPASVEKLFNASGTTNDQKGIVQRLYDTVNNSMEKIKLKAGNSFSTNQQFTMGKQLDSLNKSIDRFEDRLTQVENRYWSQFTAMEKAIQRSNEQMAYLMQQFGG
ncbi:flagellar filament capping protein FliD [Bacillus infantis]|uniref:flagellar filament capping protein FliD n=1 Tax=Bacillus infantis TaxID=324767 RepID=UPI001CD21187|nr:flagellar filament capping protein FliD [Bacillus infantis]MCA1040468.1 flagellar filament capping protein FliD [Bacillus infantis]